MRTKKKAPYNLDSKIRSALRKVWMWHPVRLKVKKLHPRCAICNIWLPLNEKAVDHKEPATPLDGMGSWDEFITRLLKVSEDDLQVLCKPCHKTKTLEENKERRKRKKAK